MAICSDLSAGKFLHAYELRLLSEGELDLFEAHLLDCEHCSSQVQEFEETAGLLRNAIEIRSMITSFASEKAAETSWAGARGWMAAAAVLLLLFYPSWLGLKTLIGDPVQEVHVISLSNTRSQQLPDIRKSSGEWAAITFLCREAVQTEGYLLEVRDQAGKVVFRKENFDSFNQFGIGHLLLHVGRLHQGNYRLAIFEKTSPPMQMQEYYFTIED